MGGQNIIWPLLHIFRGQEYPPTPRIYAPVIYHGSWIARCVLRATAHADSYVIADTSRLWSLYLWSLILIFRRRLFTSSWPGQILGLAGTVLRLVGRVGPGLRLDHYGLVLFQERNGTTVSRSGFYKNMIIYGTERWNALWLVGTEP